MKRKKPVLDNRQKFVLIAVVLLVLYMIFFYQKKACAFEINPDADRMSADSIRPTAQSVFPEPITPVDRSQVTYKDDPTILIATANRAYVIESELDIIEIKRNAQKLLMDAQRERKSFEFPAPVIKTKWCDDTGCTKWEVQDGK